MPRPRVGLVLAGGGARGAYEVGVLRYVREKLPFDARFDVVSGTSVGAINGSFIAATCDRPKAQGRLLARVWLELSVDAVYGFGMKQFLDLPRALFGRVLPKTPHGARVGGLVDTSYLEELVRTRIPWRGISENLHRGAITAFSCTATEVSTGIATVFVHSGQGGLSWPSTPWEVAVPTVITAAHTLASAAIPGLFPAVRVGDQFFVDGALRQNTPLRPAMRLGADRLLVIGLAREEAPAVRIAKLRETASFTFPSGMFLLGKLMDSVLTDKVEADVDRISQMNRLLDAGTAEFGADFAPRLSRAMGRSRPYAKVEMLHLQPSRNLSQLALEVVERTKISGNRGVVARWITRIVNNDAGRGESDLASYMLFDPHYVRALIELGYQDAAARHADLMALFDH